MPTMERTARLLSCLLLLFSALLLRAAPEAPAKPLVIGLAGTAPFVEEGTMPTGISVEIWQRIAEELDVPWRGVPFDDMQAALDSLRAGKLDAVVGPVSITAERATYIRFTQPYFSSGLSIATRKADVTLWGRVKPFFSRRFFIALSVFLFILAVVGTLLWLAERKANPDQFPPDPARGIGNGMWCAIVTMTTTGYGDIAPKTFRGRVVAGAWMVTSLAFATTMIAGIASVLTLTGLGSSGIRDAGDLAGKRIATIGGSPAEEFVLAHGGKVTRIAEVADGFSLLERGKADAFVFDRPQLQYFLQKHPDTEVQVTTAEYERQGYGFAFPPQGDLRHEVNVTLLGLQEAGEVDRICRKWLGTAGK
jgi:polar amino acid transport system substrate-binding protein